MERDTLIERLSSVTYGLGMLNTALRLLQSSTDHTVAAFASQAISATQAIEYELQGMMADGTIERMEFALSMTDPQFIAKQRLKNAD